MDTAVRIPLWLDLAAVAVGGVLGASFSVAEDDRNEFDFVSGFAVPFPARVIAEILGLPLEERMATLAALTAIHLP